MLEHEVSFTQKTGALTKYTARTYISAGVVSPPNFTLPFWNTGRKPRHPYAGIAEAIATSTTSTRRFDQPARRWTIGQTSEPRMPAEGVSAPMRTSDDAGMCSVVFPKRRAVEVIVVNPTLGNQYAVSGSDEEGRPSERRNHAAR